MPEHLTDRHRAPAPRLLRWGAGALLCLGLAWLLYAAVVHTRTGQLLDTMMRLTAHGTDHPLPALDPENHWISVWVLAPPGVVLLVLLGGRGGRLRMVTAAAAAGLVLGANLTTQLIKTVWDERPELLAGVAPDWTANSLPSGHTTMAAAAAAAVFLAALPRDRPFWAVPAALWSGGWGGYIFVEGWHRPSDMIAAYLVVAAWTCAAGWVVLRAERAERAAAGAAVGSAAGRSRAGELAPPLPDGRLRGGRNAGLCLTLGVLGSAFGTAALFGPVISGEGGLREGMVQAAASPTPWLWLAGAALSSAPAFFPAAAGILAFSAASADEHPHHARR
mgnify:CR=1 FL=1